MTREQKIRALNEWCFDPNHHCSSCIFRGGRCDFENLPPNDVNTAFDRVITDKNFKRNNSDDMRNNEECISELNKGNAEYYGYESQSNQLVEECAELIQAVNKYRRATGVGQPVEEDKRAVVLDNLIEEIVDVEIMLEQIKHLLQIPEDKLADMKHFKVNRTSERIKRSN